MLELKTKEDFRNLNIVNFDSYKFEYKGKQIEFGRGYSTSYSYGQALRDTYKEIKRKYKNSKDIYEQVKDVYMSILDMNALFLNEIIEKNYLDDVYISKIQKILYVVFMLKKINEYIKTKCGIYKGYDKTYRDYIVDTTKTLNISEDGVKYNFSFIANPYDKEFEDVLIKLIKYNKTNENADTLIKLLMLPDIKSYSKIRANKYYIKKSNETVKEIPYITKNFYEIITKIVEQ